MASRISPTSSPDLAPRRPRLEIAQPYVEDLALLRRAEIVRRQHLLRRFEIAREQQPEIGASRLAGVRSLAWSVFDSFGMDVARANDA